MKENDFIDLLFDPFNWDQKSYKFNRAEKDMNPYSVYTSDTEVTIVHNVLGINKEDLRLIRKKENGMPYIIIEGKTKDLITGKVYSVSSKFAIEESTLDLSKVTSSIRNGLLYITIPVKAETPAEEEKETSIEIL